MEGKCKSYIWIFLISTFLVANYLFVFVNCAEKPDGNYASRKQTHNSSTSQTRENPPIFISFDEINNYNKNKNDPIYVNLLTDGINTGGESSFEESETKRHKQKKVDSNQSSEFESSLSYAISDSKTSTQTDQDTGHNAEILVREQKLKEESDDESDTKSTDSGSYGSSKVSFASEIVDDTYSEKSFDTGSEDKTDSEASKSPIGVKQLLGPDKEGISKVDQVLHLLHKQSGKEAKRLNKERVERRKEILKDQEFMMDRMESIIGSLQKGSFGEKKTLDEILKNQNIPDIIEFPTMIANDEYKEKLEQQHELFQKESHEKDILKITSELQIISNVKKFFKPPIGKIDTGLFYEEKMGPRLESPVLDRKLISKGIQQDFLFDSKEVPGYEKMTKIDSLTKSTQVSPSSDTYEQEHSHKTEGKEHKGEEKGYYEGDSEPEKGQGISERAGLKTSYQDDPKLELGSELVTLIESLDIKNKQIDTKNTFGRLTLVHGTTPRDENQIPLSTYETKGILKKGSPSIGRIRRVREQGFDTASRPSDRQTGTRPKATVGRLSSPSRATTIDKMRVKKPLEDQDEYDIEAAKDFIKSKKALSTDVPKYGEFPPVLESRFDPSLHRGTRFVGDEGEKEDSAHTSRRNEIAYRRFTRTRTPVSAELFETPIAEVPRKKNSNAKRIIRRKT
ncbi:hypothetical protein FG386_003301 [Cryptosporidium ryanae]|uniref:uncharacterized protein n=1 Tax=Cryptosporidium ryanae TaxID=515981 RepID=UPI00351A9D63|nr:hypothetical protein FG386_003301 [Cryptosporidium ryanae]